MKNGRLSIKSDKELVIEDENNIIPIIIIDTNENMDKEAHMQKMKAYNTGIIFSSNKLILVSNIMSTEQELEYANFFEFNISNKEELINLLNSKYLISTYMLLFATILIYLFTVYFISNIIDIIVIGVIGYIFARIIKLRLRYKATFNIGTYALTLPMILSLLYTIVNTFTGFEIRYFQWMYTTISYIYVAVAILMIKTEIINQRIQLIKLSEIQEQASKEEENENQEENKAEHKEDEEKKEKEDKTSGEEPEGSNA